MTLRDKLAVYTVQLSETLDGLKDHAKVKVEDAWEVLQLAVVAVVQFIDENTPDDPEVEVYTGSEKKQAAMEAMSEFYDLLYISIDIPYLPRAIRKFLHPYAKMLFMKCVSGSIDATVETIKRLTNKGE